MKKDIGKASEIRMTERKRRIVITTVAFRNWNTTFMKKFIGELRRAKKKKEKTKTNKKKRVKFFLKKVKHVPMNDKYHTKRRKTG